MLEVNASVAMETEAWQSGSARRSRKLTQRMMTLRPTYSIPSSELSYTHCLVTADRSMFTTRHIFPTICLLRRPHALSSTHRKRDIKRHNLVRDE